MFGRFMKLTAVAAMCSIVGAAAATETTSTQAAIETTVTQETVKTTTATAKSIYDIPIEPMELEGMPSETTLAAYKGKVLLIVNVASKCGFTKQYAGLEDLYEQHKADGLVVLGFPSNDFKNQEPGTEKEIMEFCQGRFGVSFPMFAKISVKGTEKAPLYQYLTEGDHPGKGEVSWNFNKFLVDRKGNVVAHYESKVTPEDPVLTTQLRVLLAQKP